MSDAENNVVDAIRHALLADEFTSVTAIEHATEITNAITALIREEIAAARGARVEIYPGGTHHLHFEINKLAADKAELVEAIRRADGLLYNNATDTARSVLQQALTKIGADGENK